MAVTTLLLGGARSGKSELAEVLAARAAAAAEPRRPVTFVATASVSADDPEFAERISAHRARRPADWLTVEVPLGGDLPRALEGDTVVVVDSLGTWLAGLEGFRADLEALVSVLGERTAPAFLVSDEVGMGVHPETEAGRMFRDALGEMNRAVASVATEVLLVVAGRALRLEACP